MKTNLLLTLAAACAFTLTACHHHTDSTTVAIVPSPVIGVSTAPIQNPPPAPDQAVRTDSDEYYLSLMTPDEREILRARAQASGRTDYQLTDFLTPEERANLRRRDPNRHPVGQP